MTYELVKKLKDAGLKLLLPSGAQKAGFCKHNLWGYENRISCDCTPEDHAPIPDLKTLIEVCGDGFLKLERLEIKNDIYWDARSKIQKDGMQFSIILKSPEEAVANLYLRIIESENN